jgi:hypothetical protein
MGDRTHRQRVVADDPVATAHDIGSRRAGRSRDSRRARKPLVELSHAAVELARPPVLAERLDRAQRLVLPRYGDQPGRECLRPGRAGLVQRFPSVIAVRSMMAGRAAHPEVHVVLEGDRPKAVEDGIVVEPMGDELIVFDARVQRAHSLNATARAVWRACDGEHTPAQLAGILALDRDAVLLAIRPTAGCWSTRSRWSRRFPAARYCVAWRSRVARRPPCP